MKITFYALWLNTKQSLTTTTQRRDAGALERLEINISTCDALQEQLEENNTTTPHSSSAEHDSTGKCSSYMGSWGRGLLEPMT